MCDGNAHQHPKEYRVGSFNLLCDGLSYDEFFCVEGETNRFTAWSYRENKIADILRNMFNGIDPEEEQGGPPCAIVVTQENDHFYQILRKIRSDSRCSNVAGVYGVNSKISKGKISHGTAFRVKAQRLLRGANVVDDSILSNKSELYKHVNAAFHNGDLNHLKLQDDMPWDGKRASEVIRSYHEECGDEFIQQALDIYSPEANRDDIYLSDDGIGVFYNKDIVELLDIGLPGVEDPTIISADAFSEASSIAVRGIDSAIRCLFKVKESCCQDGKNKFILFYGCHLKSGEAVKDAITRYEQLKLIVADSQQYLSIHSHLFGDCEVIPVFAMDSNNSKHYEETYPARGSFVKVQSVDKNYVDVEFSSTLSDYLEANHLIDGVHIQDSLYDGRNQCLKMRNGKTEQKSKAFQLMFDTIDKIIVPDSQNVILDRINYFGFKTYDSSSGAFFNDIRSSAQKRATLYNEFVNNVESSCAKEALGENNPFVQLYPNEFAPSDHVPVSIILKF